MKIKVSVIIPVYNCQKYLDRCVLSLINQSLSEIELIFVNDCSTDNSLNILKKYKNNYQNNKIIIIDSKENLGVGGARNKGIDIAEGEYIGFVDSDDDVSPKMFEEMYKIAERADYDMVDCGLYYEKEHRDVITTYKEALGKLDTEKRKLLIKSSGYVWSKIIKTDILKKNNIRFREKTAFEDCDFIPAVILYCTKICATNMTLYNYRENTESITHSKNKKIYIEQKINGIKALFDEFEDLGVYNEYKDIIDYRAYCVYDNILKVLSKDNDKNNNILLKKLSVFFSKFLKNYDNNKYIDAIDKDDRNLVEENDRKYLL